MKTGVIYARYSAGPNQTDQSIEGQVADCRAYAASNDIQIVEIYADHHISGKSLEGRDELKRLLYDAEHHKFDCVVTWKIDRLGRDRYDLANCKMKLKRAGVELHYAKESVPDGPEGIILESVLEGLAEYYSADLRQKVTRGIRESAKKGVYCGASIPVGYKLDEGRHVIIDEPAAEGIREAFKMHINGAKIKDILEMFKRRGIKTNRGSDVSAGVLHRILRNERYMGVWELAGVPLSVPGIIDGEIFMEAQKHFKTSRNNAAGNAKTDYLLSGKVICGYCGATVRGHCGKSHTGDMHYYYACGAKKDGKACELKTVKKSDLEDAVIESVCSDLLTDDTIEMIAARIMELQLEDQKHERLHVLERQLEDAEKRQGKLLDALEIAPDVSGLIDRLRAIDEEIKNLKSEITGESIKQPMLSKDAVVLWLAQFKNGDKDDARFRSRLVETFIDKVELRNGEAYVFFNVSGRDRQEGLPTIRQVDLKESSANLILRPDCFIFRIRLSA